MAQVQNAHWTKNSSFQKDELSQAYSFCFGMELYIPPMIRLRARTEQKNPSRNYLDDNKLAPSERNFIILENRRTNCFKIHLANENSPCKCSGSIFRTSALSLEWSDIYSFWETPTHGGCWRLTAVYYLITAGVKCSYKTMTMETNNGANHLLYVWHNQFAWFFHIVSQLSIFALIL